MKTREQAKARAMETGDHSTSSYSIGYHKGAMAMYDWLSEAEQTEPTISNMVKANIIVNWEDWLTVKGYSDDFVELDSMLTEYLNRPDNVIEQAEPKPAAIH